MIELKVKMRKIAMWKRVCVCVWLWLSLEKCVQVSTKVAKICIYICVKFWTHTSVNVCECVCQDISEIARFPHLYSFPSPIKMKPIHDGGYYNGNGRERREERTTETENKLPEFTFALEQWVLLLRFFGSFVCVIFFAISNWKSIHIIISTGNILIASSTERAG